MPKRGRSRKSDDKAPADNQDDRASAVDEYFFKISRPEDKRDKEHDIIKNAHNRVEKYLSAQHRNDVLHLLPDVMDSRDTCTAIVPVLVRDGSRSQYWIISKKLRSLSSVVHDFDKFKKIFCHLIRCHRLLWTIGIAHGDISFSNLMYDETNEGPQGILNDFDLAAMMDPDASSPSQTGFRRTGTKMFMALRLLEKGALDGKVVRCYRHELESFAWVLLYACICIDDDVKERLDRAPISAWIQADHASVQVKKSNFLDQFPIHIRTYAINLAYLKVLTDTLHLWFNEHWDNLKNDYAALKKRLKADSTTPLADQALLHQAPEDGKTLPNPDQTLYQDVLGRAMKNCAEVILTGQRNGENSTEEISTVRPFTDLALLHRALQAWEC